MYDTQEEVDNILMLAKAFQKAINNNRICAVTREWFEGDNIRHKRAVRRGDRQLFYTRALAREEGTRYRTNEQIAELI